MCILATAPASLPIVCEVRSDNQWSTVRCRWTGQIIGTLRAPYVIHKSAAKHGGQWELTDRDGETVLVRNLRPTFASIARALAAS